MQTLPFVDFGSNVTVNDFRVGNYRSCALMNNSKLKCWGDGVSGQLGYGDTLIRGDEVGDMGDNLPYLDLGTDLTVKSFDFGASFACALLSNDSVKCWGFNTSGRLGLGDTSNRGDNSNEMGDSLPALSFGSGLVPVEIATGENFSCARFSNGKVKCWGVNQYGQLGQGDTINRGDQANEMGDNLPFVDLGTDVSVSALALSGEHACALLSGGGVKCWGSGTYGKLGLGDFNYRGDEAGEMGDALPLLSLGSNLTVTKVKAGWDHTCFLFSNGRIKCVGAGGRLGNGNTNHIGDQAGEMGNGLGAIDFGNGLSASHLSCGNTANCAIFSNGRIKCWGNNFGGALGIGNTINKGDDPGEMGDALPFIQFE
jgi:alpha-tubulin suppressor-like RCC1 family protein